MIQRWEWDKNTHCLLPNVEGQWIHIDNCKAVFKELADVLKAWETWEADLIMNGDWSGETLRLTQEQHDALTPIQIQRSKAIARTKQV